jgi:hypothetical protein
LVHQASNPRFFELWEPQASNSSCFAVLGASSIWLIYQMGVFNANAGSDQADAVREYLRTALLNLDAAWDSATAPAAIAALEEEQERSLKKMSARELVTALLAADVPARLLERFDALSFEARKNALSLVGEILVLGEQLGASEEVVQNLQDHVEMLLLLLECCEMPEVALHRELLFRACARHRELATRLLDARAPFRLLELAQHPHFYVSSEAIGSLRELLLAQGNVSSAYLEANFEEFFGSYHALLLGGDYVTQRQLLKLLGEMLLDPEYIHVMLKYVGCCFFHCGAGCCFVSGSHPFLPPI